MKTGHAGRYTHGMGHADPLGEAPFEFTSCGTMHQRDLGKDLGDRLPFLCTQHRPPEENFLSIPRIRGRTSWPL